MRQKRAVLTPGQVVRELRDNKQWTQKVLSQITGIAVLGALWAGRVSAHGGTADPTEAPLGAQVGALTDTMTVVVGLIVFALALAIWSLWQDRRSRRVVG